MNKINFKITFILPIFFISCYSFSQIGVSYNHSNLPFIGINYQMKNDFLTELRIGTDNFIEDTSLELTINYMFKRTETVDVYAGLGGRIGFFEGLVVPAGLNIYPFEKKKFGFQIELAPILGDSNILRGSAGIRYRF